MLPEVVQSTQREDVLDIMRQKMLRAFQEDIKNSTAHAVSLTLNQAESFVTSMTDTLISEFNQKLNDVAKPRILYVSFSDSEELVKLKGAASPYLEALLTNAKLGFNSLLVGPAGCGKTMAAEQLAEALKKDFGHICLTAGASETWLFGRQTPTGFKEGVFSRMYREGGVFLADEFDGADPNLLLAINTAIANTSFYNPISGEMIHRNPEFYLVAAANTNGRGGNEIYTGRSRIDAATLDRFVIIEVDYNEDLELMICPEFSIREKFQGARKKLRDLKAVEVISTRTLDRAFRMHQAGVAMDTIVRYATAGWPKEIIEHAGL